MRRSTLYLRFVTPFGAALLVACQDAPSAVDHARLHQHEASAAVVASPGLLREVTRATVRYRSTQQATRAGYQEDPHCVEVPGLGGMGHHWANPTLVDPVFNPLQPEVMLYAPDANGRMKLVAVEYIVINVGQPAPTFGGQPFDVGGTPVPVPHWSLHVWAHQANPNGTFTPFNPTVSCTPNAGT
jgi:hypothetical protein